MTIAGVTPPMTWGDIRGGPAHAPLFDLIAAQFRLLGEPVRLQLLAALREGERSVGELVALTSASQPNVSKHLQALARGGLVRRRKDGTTIRYAIDDPTIAQLCDIVCTGVQARMQAQARALGFGVTMLPPVEGR